MASNDKVFIVEMTNDTAASATLLNAIFTVKRVRTWRVVPAYGTENPWVVVEIY